MIKYDCRDDSFVAHAQLPRILDMRRATQKSTYGIGSKLFNTQIKKESCIVSLVSKSVQVTIINLYFTSPW